MYFDAYGLPAGVWGISFGFHGHASAKSRRRPFEAKLSQGFRRGLGISWAPESLNTLGTVIGWLRDFRCDFLVWSVLEAVGS